MRPIDYDKRKGDEERARSQKMRTPKGRGGREERDTWKDERRRRKTRGEIDIEMREIKGERETRERERERERVCVCVSVCV